MDKWTKQFMATGPSRRFLKVIELTTEPGKLEPWARAHTDGMFGAVFGLGQSLEFLKFRPLLARDLSDEETKQYRRICAAANLSQEQEIPPLFLLFRKWGFGHLREYLSQVISQSQRSHWQWMNDSWEECMAAVETSEWAHLGNLEEPSKLVIYRAALAGGRLPKDVVPRQHRRLSVFTQPSLDECVRYTLEDMKSTDLAAVLKELGYKQSGTKAERIGRIISVSSTPDLARLLNVTSRSYLHLGNDATERDCFTQATVFLHAISDAVFRLDYLYTHNLYRINQASEQKWGIRLSHHAKCPVHRRTVFSHRELHLIDPIAHPDCDADFGPML